MKQTNMRTNRPSFRTCISDSYKLIALFTGLMPVYVAVIEPLNSILIEKERSIISMERAIDKAGLTSQPPYCIKIRSSLVLTAMIL